MNSMTVPRSPPLARRRDRPMRAGEVGASRVTLACGHIVAAAIVIPIIARRLP